MTCHQGVPYYPWLFGIHVESTELPTFRHSAPMRRQKTMDEHGWLDGVKWMFCDLTQKSTHSRRYCRCFFPMGILVKLCEHGSMGYVCVAVWLLRSLLKTIYTSQFCNIFPSLLGPAVSQSKANNLDKNSQEPTNNQQPQRGNHWRWRWWGRLRHFSLYSTHYQLSCCASWLKSMLLWTQQNKKLPNLLEKTSFWEWQIHENSPVDAEKNRLSFCRVSLERVAVPEMIRNAEWNIDGGHINIPSIIFRSVFLSFHKNTDL